MNMPTLESDRLFLTPFADKHLSEDYVSWLNDPLVTRYSEQRHKTHSLESCRAFVNTMRDNNQYFWAIELKEHQNPHIGNVSGYVDRNNQICELSILLGNAGLHNKGLGLEAWSCAQDWLLSQPDIRKTHAGTMACNTGMLKVFERSGMRVEGRKRDHFLYENGAVDLIYAGKFKTD